MGHGSGWVGSWSPGIGDPTLMGWLTVVAYLVTAWLSLRAFKAQKTTPDRRGGTGAYIDALRSCLTAFQYFRRPILRVPGRARLALFWFICAATFLFLGVNKQLDLQSLITEVGRILAYGQGWYEQRRTLQVALVVGAGVFGLLALVTLTLLVWGVASQVDMALVGLCFTVSFVVARAASFHYFDILIDLELFGLRMNWILELTGIGLVALNARRVLRSAVPPQPAVRPG